MTEQGCIKKELEEQLIKVKQRLEILDMLEEKLLKKKELAQRVVDNNLNNEESKKTSIQVKNLEEQVKLLDSQSTQLS